MAQDVAKQLQTYGRIVDYLEELSNDLDNRVNEYVARVRALEAEGMDVSVASKYKSEFWQPNMGNMQQLLRNIKERDIPYMKRCIEGAQMALSNYTE